jgi:hypothetical protein
MNLKAMAVMTGLTLATGLNFPILAASNHLIASNLGQATSSLLNSAIAQAQKPKDTKPSDTMSNPNHTSNSMKKPTGAMSSPNHTGDSMKKPTGNATKKPVSNASRSPNSTGDAMKKTTGDTMTKPKG